jgi:DNA polymerase-4
MGVKLLKTAAVTGIREIGEVAALSETEALSLFGRHGTLLRNMAQGIDNSPVEDLRNRRGFTHQVDFDEDVIDETIITGALEVLVQHGGLQMRNEKLGMRNLRLTVIYTDGVEAQGVKKVVQPLVTSSEILAAVYDLFKKTRSRRIRIRSIHLDFEDLTPLRYQPDLFEPETETKNRRLQEAVDKIQNRYGVGKITKALALGTKKTKARELTSVPGVALYGY